MKQRFYSHVVNHDVIQIELANLDLSEKEKNHLMVIVEASTHHVVIDILLTHLPDTQKTIFLQLAEENDHEKVWTHLQKHVKEPEGKIIEGIKKLQKDFLKDIQKLQKKS